MKYAIAKSGAGFNQVGLRIETRGHDIPGVRGAATVDDRQVLADANDIDAFGDVEIALRGIGRALSYMRQGAAASVMRARQRMKIFSALSG